MATLLEKCNNIKNDKDTNLKPENLKAGITCLGVTGTLTELDTSDATATSSDIVFGKTAYVNGKKIEGLVYEVPAGASLTLEGNGAEDLPSQSKLLVTCPSEADVFFKQNSGADIVTSYDKIANAIGLTSDKLAKGNTILGIEGAAEIESTSGDVKLFETIDEMQTDVEAKEGDLALVYRNEIQPITVDSHFSKAVFPETVVLPSTMTDYADLMFRAVDDSIMFECWGQLDTSMFMMDCYTETGNTRIQYESSDGITYNRTRLEGNGVDGNSVDFGTEIHYAHSEMWNDAISYFIQAGGMYFEGLYEYREDSVFDKGLVTISKVFNTESDIAVFDISDIPLKEVPIRTNEWYQVLIVPSTWTEYTFRGNTIRKVTSAWIFNEGNVTFSKNNTEVYINYGVYETEGVAHWSIESGIEFHLASESEKFVIGGDYFTMYKDYNLIDKYMLKLEGNSIDNFSIDNNTGIHYFNTDAFPTDVTSSYSLPSNDNSEFKTWMYFPANTQLSSIKSNELLPGVIGYGDNGIVIGDGNIYDNLDVDLINSITLKVPLVSEDDSYHGAGGWIHDVTSRQQMISYSANDNGANFIACIDESIKIPYFSQSVKYDEDTVIGVHYDNTNKIFTAYKYKYSTNTLTTIGTISDISGFDGDRLMIAIDSNKENVYFVNRYNYSTLDCYKIDLVANTFTKLFTCTGDECEGLDRYCIGIIVPDQQAIYLDTKYAVKKLNFDKTSSVLISKTGYPYNEAKSSLYHSTRYLSVKPTSGGRYVLYDIKTNSLTDISHSGTNVCDCAWEVGDTFYSYCYDDDTLLVVKDGVLIKTLSKPFSSGNKIGNSYTAYPNNEPFIYDNKIIIPAWTDCLFDLSTNEVELLPKVITNAGCKLLNRTNKDVDMHYMNVGTVHVRHVDVQNDNTGEFLGFLSSDKNRYYMRKYEYDYLVEHKCLPSVKNSI